MQERQPQPGFYIRRFPLLSEIGNAVDNNVKNFGLQRGTLETLSAWGVKLKLENLTPEIIKVFEEGPAILVGNHPTLTEPLVLPASLPEREDVFMVMSQSFLSLFPSLKEHTLPIYMGYRTESEKAIVNILRKTLTYGGIDYAEAHKRNIESIDQAASRVSDGELGIIFPGPIRKLAEGQWKAGLGYLVDGIQYPSETYLIEAYVEGTAWHDLARTVPPLRSRYSEIKVTFRDPQKIADVKDGVPRASERELVTRMEKDYLDWAHSLKNS